jgi:hypothetical protein
MKHIVIKKGLVFGLVLLLAGFSICSMIEAQHENIPTLYQDGFASSYAQDALGKKAPSLQNLLSIEMQQQVQQAMANETNGYVIYTSSGNGNSVHLFAKIPHLKNSKGFCLGGIIVYTGLSALTMVWRIANGTASDVADMRVGPHVVIFTGFGYSWFFRNKVGGLGKLVAVSLSQPSLIP